MSTTNGAKVVFHHCFSVPPEKSFQTQIIHDDVFICINTLQSVVDDIAIRQLDMKMNKIATILSALENRLRAGLV